MSKPTFRKVPLALAISLAGCVALPVFADGAGIEEIVVTAQKREQSLQQTPIAISALGSDAIETQDIRDVKALNGLVPNMRLVSPPTASTGATINIRGAVTINPALTLESTVGMYLDGIYLGKSVGTIFDVADLERVEVLRGPQGTLYGKNTLGGAINLITKKPTGEFGGDLRLTMGNYGLLSGKLDLDLPALGTIGEGAGRLSAKVAISRTGRDGFYTNDDTDAPGAQPASGRDFGNVNNTSGRFVLRWQPAEAVDVQYAYDGSRVDQRPQFFQITKLNQPLLDLLSGGTAPDLTPFAGTSRLKHGSQNAALEDKADVDGHSLIASWDAGTLGALGDVTFKSLTAHREVRARDEQDWDGSPYELLHSGRIMGYRETSQELQMIGRTERLNYIGGLYYFAENGNVTNPLILPLYGVTAQSRYGLKNDSWAAYTQFEWTPPLLDDRLKLTLGGRYTHENKSIYKYLTPTDRENYDKSYNNFSPAFIASFAVTEDINVYGKVARGWKAGVFNAEANDPAIVAEPVKQETVTAYELGVKSKWWDNRIQANLAAFYDQHRDMQISRFNAMDGTSFLTNAGSATVRGAELELTTLPIDNLELSLAYGYMNARYNKYEDVCNPTARHPCAVPGQEYDAKDVNKFPYTPRGTANASVQYTQPLPVGAAVARLDWSYTDHYYIFPDPANYENTDIDGYSLVDARLMWDKVPVDRALLSVSAWVKNLTNKQYRVNGLEWAGLFTTMHYGDPRTFGVDVAVKF